MAGATTIDELVVELGLDAQKFVEGQKRALEEAKKFKERLEQFGKDAEGAGNRGAAFFGAMKGGAMAVGQVLMDLVNKLVDFTKQIVTVDASSYRFSQTMGKSTREVTAWDAAFAQFAGKAGLGVSLFDRLGQASANAFMRGDYSFFVTLQRMNVQIADLVDKNGQITNTTELLFRMSDAFSKMPKTAAIGFAEALGLSQDQLYALEQGRALLAKIVAQKNADVAVTDAQGKAAQEVIQRWNAMSQAAEGVGRAISYAILDKLMQLADWFKQNTPVIEWFNAVLDWALPKWREFRADAGKDAAASLGGGTAAPGTGPQIRSSAGDAYFGRTPGSGATMPLPDMSKFGGGATTGGADLHVKGGAGEFTIGTYALASVLQNSVPGFNRVTAADDEYHAGTGSMHAQGRAIDFTIAGGRGAAAGTAQGIREQLRAMGIDATVLDEYNHPSTRATAGHLHVQFNSEAAAQRFSERAGFGGNAGQAVNIGTININTNATDAAGIARDIRGAIQRNSFGAQANAGQQ